MSSTSKDLLTIFTGQRMNLRLVSKSWGERQPNLVDGADWTPNLTAQTLMEYGNLNPALVYTVFDDVTFKCTYPQNNQMQFESLLMDWDQTVDALMVDPSNMTPFTAYANMQGLDGRIKGSWLVRDITPTGNPFTSTVKADAKRTLEGKGLQAVQFHGLAISYARLRGTTVMQPQPPAAAATVTTTGGALTAGAYYTAITAVTAAGESLIGPEAMTQVVDAGGASEIALVTPTITAPVTGYNVYAGNRSGDLRLAGAASGTSFTLTALPAVGAPHPPAQNTTGVPVVANDVVLSSVGNVWSGTLPKAAIINAQTGLPYILIRRNGITIAGPDSGATQDTVAISADGVTFSANDTAGATSWYDVWTLYKPNPA